jgi:hypothetical protein
MRCYKDTDMRVEDDSKEFKIVLQDTGEIARMLQAIVIYNASLDRKAAKIPVRVVELLEEALQQE